MSKAFLIECIGNPVSACLEGLVYWREGNKPCKEATWRVLLEALEEGAERKSYAKRLRNALIRNASRSEHQPGTERETTHNTRECTVRNAIPSRIHRIHEDNINGHQGTIFTLYICTLKCSTCQHLNNWIPFVPNRLLYSS